MERSAAARPGLGRGRILSSPRPGGLGLRGLARRGPGALRALLRGLLARRRARIALICALAAVPLLGGGFLALRHSSLVAVDHVRISGVHGPQSHQIEEALQQAARGMSTLDYNAAALQAAVARFPMVAAVRARTSFPHSISIVVIEQPPVAELVVAGVKTAVAADGVTLGPGLSSASLPEVADDVAPAAGEHLRNPLVLAALRVLGAAPRALDRLAEKAFYGPKGLTVVMRNGLQVYFGEDSLAHAKWLSLAGVLADKSSAGAIYVDVRLPDRPAAGFTEGTTHTEASSTESASGTESAVSALAAGLSADSPEPKTTGAETGSTTTETQTGSTEAPHESGAPAGESSTAGAPASTEAGG
jgi:cell division protein FtsQ